jgi:hypothetical protein
VIRLTRPKAIVLTTTALIVAVGVAWGECDCTIYPFKPDPPCSRECCGRVLKATSSTELQSILAVNREMAEKIKDQCREGQTDGPAIIVR